MILDLPCFIKKGRELILPRSLLIELLTAVHEKGGSFRFRAKGFSMSPFIKNGDVITISPISGLEISTGVVVAFQKPQTGDFIIHRVIKKRGSFYIIKGDNWYEVDGLIERSNILGCVTRVERNGRKLFFGLGLERYIIAFLARYRLLWLLIHMVQKIYGFISTACSLILKNYLNSKNIN
jgi:signal peptidase I